MRVGAGQLNLVAAVAPSAGTDCASTSHDPVHPQAPSHAGGAALGDGSDEADARERKGKMIYAIVAFQAIVMCGLVGWILNLLSDRTAYHDLAVWRLEMLNKVSDECATLRNQLKPEPEHAHMPYCTMCDDPWTRARKVKVISFVHLNHLRSEPERDISDHRAPDHDRHYCFPVAAAPAEGEREPNVVSAGGGE